MFFVCIALWGLIACGSSSKNDFPNLSPDEFERLIQDENVQRVDVRTVAEYSEGHIPFREVLTSMYWMNSLRLMLMSFWTRMNLLQSIAKAEEEAEMLPAC